MEKIEKYMKQALKNKVKITKALMIAFLINGGFALAENNPITPGTNLGGDNATAIGAGSVSAGSEASSIGTNTFASGNNMTKEEYLKFLKDNKERLSKIEKKMQEIKNDKDEIQKLRQEHNDIISKIDRINNYKKAIEDKEKELNEKEPQILKIIEEKKNEEIKFTKEIENLENKLNMITKLRVDKLEEAKNENRINVIAQDLKHRMEDGTAFLKKEIPISEYENYLNSVIANTKKFYIYDSKNNDELKNTNIFFDKTTGLSPSAVPIKYIKDEKGDWYTKYIYDYEQARKSEGEKNKNYISFKPYFKQNKENIANSQIFYDNGKFKIAYNLKSDDGFLQKPKEYSEWDDEQQFIDSFLSVTDTDISYDSFMKCIKRNLEKQKLGVKTEFLGDRIKESYLNIDKKTYENKLKELKYYYKYNENINEYNYNHVEEIEYRPHFNKYVYGWGYHQEMMIHGFGIQRGVILKESDPMKFYNEWKKNWNLKDVNLKNGITKEEIYTQLFNVKHNNEIKLESTHDDEYYLSGDWGNIMYLLKDDIVDNNDINHKAIDFVKPLANQIKTIENNINLRNIENNKKKCNDVSCLLTYTEYTPEEKQQIEEIKSKYKEFNNIIDSNPLNEKEFIDLIYDIAKTKPTTDDFERQKTDFWWSANGKQNTTLLDIFTTWNFKKGTLNNEMMEKLKNEQNRRETIYESRKFVKVYQDEIDRLKKLEKDANTYITEKEDLIKGYKNDIENLKSLLNSEHPSDVEEVNKQIQEKEEKIKKALADIENLKKNLTEIKPGTNALAYGTNSAALGKDSIAFGTNNIAINESSIAFGTNNFVNGNKSIALGYGHKIIGDRSVTLGDPNLIFGNDNFAIGNNIKIGTETQKVNNNLVFGTNVTIDGINNAIVFGDKSKAVEGAVSFGNDTTARKLKFIAEGKDGTDAVNVKQLQDYVRQNLVNVQGADVNITNLLKNKVDKTEYNTEISNINNKITDGLKIKLDKDGTNLDKTSLDKLTNKLSGESDISKPNNRLVTDTKVKQYLDTNFKIQNYVVGKEVLDIKKDAAEAVEKAGLALGGVANAIAMANLTTTESGIANLTAAYGTYGKEHALAIGFNGNTPNRRFNYKFGLSTNMKGNLGIGAGVGFVIGGTTEQRQTQQERKIKALEKQLQEMSEVLKKLQLKNNEKTKESIEKH